MSTKTTWLEHRGALRDLVSDGTSLFFVTEHPEGRPTALYRLDPLKGKLEQQGLPGAVAMCLEGGDFFLAGTDGHVYGGAFGACKALGKALDPAPTAVVAIAKGVAVLSGSFLVLLNAKGKETARFELPAAGTALASARGEWLAAGCVDGTVAVFSAEESKGKSWEALEKAALHQGAVTTLTFEPDELRIRSTGVDNKLALTHARGVLEPEDRSGRNGHAGPVRGVCVTEKHAYTVGEDGGIKTWVRGSRRVPSTQKDGVGKPVAAALVTVDGDAHIAVASADDAIRLFPLDKKSGKAQARTRLFPGALARVGNELAQTDATRRQAALDLLASWDDAAAIELLQQRAGADSDPALQIRATDHLGASKHARAIPPLEGLLRSRNEGVRKAALGGLRARLGNEELRPLELALASGQADIGVAAIQALGALAPKDSRAQTMLESALDAGEEIRSASLETLETLHPKVPMASLLGFRSKHASLRWKAGLRLLQRDLLSDPTALRALRSLTSDGDADVRQLAYHLILCAYPNLCARLSYEDTDLNRQLHELRTHGDKKPGKPTKPKKPKTDPETLSVLFQAAASRSRDTSLRGAAHLAALGDGRAFGILLQLSRDGDASIRERVCRALQKLADPRALDRLQAMLRDGAEGVRDAAFSAVERLLTKEPLRAAEIGLAAPQADTRKRGLRVVTKVQKSKPSKAGQALLLRALNDSDRKLRNQAFKAALKLEKDPETALRFVFGSLREDIRREALTEVMSQIRLPWGWALLLERFDDPSAKLRAEALEFARKKGRGRTPDPVAAALTCSYADLRIKALEALATKVNDATAPQLILALDDDEQKVRTRALAALMRAGRIDSVVDALGSRHADVKLTAARALSGLGRAEALPVLIEQIAMPVPETADLAKLHRARVVEALLGLALLDDVSAVEPIRALLRDESAEVRNNAAHALAHCADAESLRGELQHEDAAVRLQVAQGLAWLGDPIGASLVFEKATAWEQAVAAVCLGELDRLLGLIDHRDDATSTSALRLLLLLAWAQPEFPSLLLAALTSERPAARLAVARVLEAWNDGETLSAALTEVLNARDNGPIWEIEAEYYRRLSLAVAHGEGRARTAAMDLIPKLAVRTRRTAELEQAQATMRHEWTQAVCRYAVLDGIADPGPPAAADVSGLVFGAYVGLSSEVSRQHRASIRASAIRRMAVMADAERQAVIDAVIPGLSDPDSSVRRAAFEALTGLELDANQLAGEALATGTTDMGSAGLKLLSEKGGDKVLITVAMERTDRLAEVALGLLVERDKPIAKMIDAASKAVRTSAVTALAKNYDDSKAKKALIGALKSAHAEVRLGAAQALARRRDKAAFDPLVALLRSADQGQAIKALVQLADPRVPGALLDRIDEDPQGTAQTSELLSAAAGYRDPEIMGRLVELAADDKHRKNAVEALITISGYDQRLRFDPEHPDADTSWLERQHARNDEVFATALGLLTEKGNERRLKNLWTATRWAHGAEVHAPLGQMLVHAKDGIRRNATAAIGWRLRHRDASPDLLRPLLAHKDAGTSFLAAEGLAHAGQTDGLSVLLASVETLDDVKLRSRAVLALGLLADERALDTLLRIVEDEAHALIEAAAEAIGHLSKSSAAADILARLKQLAAGEATNVARRALVGLRWFDTPTAWAVIHGRVRDESWAISGTALDLLGHDDRPEARDALKRCILEPDYWRMSQTAGNALRRLEGPDSLVPDYIFVRAPDGSPEEDTIQRLRERGEPGKILDALADPGCDDEMVEPLMLALAARDPLPIDDAVGALTDSRVRSAGLAARLLGRAKKLKKPVLTSLVDTLGCSLKDWRDRFEREEDLDDTTERITWLVWACSKHSVGGEYVAAALRMTEEDAAPIRQAATAALSLGGQADLLEEALGSSDASVRATAAGALVAVAPDRAAKAVSLDDLGSTERVLRSGASPPGLSDAAGQVHTQGIVLPHLVERGDVKAIGAALSSTDEGALLSAIEALGFLGKTAAEDQLRGFASDESRDEELRKAAWRALRRSKRNRARKEAR